jgi:hypothetical protein
MIGMVALPPVALPPVEGEVRRMETWARGLRVGENVEASKGAPPCNPDS